MFKCWKAANTGRYYGEKTQRNDFIVTFTVLNFVLMLVTAELQVSSWKLFQVLNSNVRIFIPHFFNGKSKFSPIYIVQCY